MSIIDTFDPTGGEILRPSDASQAIDGFPETVLVTFKPEIIKMALSMGEFEILDVMYVFFQIPVYRIRYKGRELALYQTLLGGAASASMMEEVIAKGGRKFVLFGSCGTLDRTLSAGHLIVPTAAYRDEGVSYHYLPKGDYVEIPTAEKLGAILSKLEIPYVTGKTWTTDAIYRETRRSMDARRAEGCVAVDMECASLMAVAQYRGVALYQYLYGEDNLDGLRWEPRTMCNVPPDAFERYLEIALKIALRV